MKKTIATLSLTAVLAMTLAGCTFELRDPVAIDDSKNPTDPTIEVEAPGGSNSSNFGSGACDDRDLVIDEEGSQLVLTGDCGSVTITADDVSVNLEHAETVTISGDYVTVLATTIDAAEITGSNVTLNPDDIGSVSIGGDYITFTSNGAEKITISCNYNVANWSTGAASATDTGTGNTVVAP